MKKRILALALAGTTAFSVFSMGVSALEVDEHVTDELVAAADVALTTAGGKLFVGGTEITKENYGKYTWFNTDDADVAVDEGVEAKTIYVYDFVESLSIDYDVEDLEEALDKAFTEGKFGDLVEILDAHGGKLAWDYDSDFRDDVLDIWDDFVDNVVAESDLVKEGSYLDYYFDELLDEIAKVDASDVYATSSRISIMNVYNAYIDDLALVDSDDLVEKIDALIEKLEARTEDDFASTRKYNDYTKKLDKALEAYADADTVSEYTKVKASLEAVAALKYAAAADKDAAEELLESLFTDGKYDDKKTDYAAAGKVVYDAADYDNTKEDLDDGDPYDVFVDAYKTLIETMSKSKSELYQSDLDLDVAALEDAVAALEVVNVAEDWEIAKLDWKYGQAEDKIEGDYTVKSWKAMDKAMETAVALLDSDAPGKNAVDNAITALDDAMAALVAATVKTADWTELKNTLKEAKALLKTLDKDKTGSLGQYYALKDAIEKADKFVDAGKSKAVNSKVAAQVEALEAAMNYSETVMGWVETDAGWAYGTEDGYVQNGWYKVKDNWAYFQNGVALESQWIKLEGTWYYLNSYCYAARGWAKIDGKWYFFNDGCAMLANTTVDGYVLSASGAMVE
ncbi:MAG: hypothetical protein IKM31_08395 [Oscillospiraceae bacterium]|nr:hypothetical protein [Oscillospiraceae bacterium]